jgi:hypothetical protein
MAGKTSPWVWVGIGCGVAIAGFIAFVAFIIFVVFAAMRSADPYRDAVARAQTDPRVIEALGSPVKPGWFMSGSIKTQNDTGSADISVSVSGPKQSASVAVIGSKQGGRWTYTKMLVTPERGEPIDLLTSSAGSTGTAPPGE